MQKLIMSCPQCHQKMKIQKKAAKYRCPHCSTIVMVSSSNLFFLTLQNYANNFRFKIKTKYQNMKNTYQYLKMVRNNKRKP